MCRSRNRLLLLSLALILIGSAGVIAQSGRGRGTPPPPKPTPKPGTPAVPVTTVLNVPEGGKILRQDVESATTRYVLKNGLTIIIRERHSSPLAAVTTYVKAGYFNEPDEIAGLAHLMEHMFFKGTPTRPLGTIASETRRLGGVLNASTFYEKTSYYTVAPAESLPKILEIQADLLQNPTFDAAELKKEALVVIQESKRKQDNATALALERMLATAFTAHRMKRWRIGSDEVLQAATREQLQAFYQNYYRPNNIVLAIVGPVFAPQIIGQIQQLYGNFQKADVTLTPGPEEPPQEKLRYSNERGDIGQTIVTVGYHAPAIVIGKEGPAKGQPTPESLREQATMEVLSAVLGLGRGARLTQVLREGSRQDEKAREKEQFGVTDVAVEYMPLPGVGMLSVQLRLDPDRIDRAEAEYFREIERFKRELISEGELQRARSLLEKRFYDAITSSHDEAEELARCQAQFGDFRLLDKYIERIRAVTAKDIQQAAAKYLTLANATVHEYEPRNTQARTFTAESFTELIGVFAPLALQPVKADEVKPAVALKTFKQGEERSGPREGENIIMADAPLPIKDFSVYRGPRAYVREDHSQPRLAVGVFFQGGRLIEDQTTSGTTELMLRTMMKSTTKRKADLIALELESYGGEISLVNEPDFFGFTLDVLSRNAESAINLLLEIIESPYFDKTELARERDGLLARGLQQRDDGLQRPIELMWASLYPNHPYGLPRFGLPGVVKALNEEKLEAWHAKTIKRQLPLVILVGDTDGSSLVSRIFSESFKRDEVDQTIKANLPPLAATPQEQVEPRSRKQTAQAIGFRTPAGQSNDNQALAVLQNFASGLGGRFFTELRDKQSLAYTVALGNQPRLASGAFFAYIATLPENEQQARDGLRAQLERLISAPPSDEEFERGRNAAIGFYAMSLQAHSARVLEYARAVIFGRKAADVEAQPDLIRAVKKDDIKRVAEAVIKLTHAGRGVVRGDAVPPTPNKD
jgi:zinc protease